MNDTVQAEAQTDSAPNRVDTHSALPAEETERLGADIVAALKTVYDPEIPPTFMSLA